MQLKSLKIFCDIVRRRSFSRAAVENNMSQSSASQVVHQLEEHLGVKLLDRSRRPFVLTPEGECYYEGCQQLVKLHRELEQQVRSLHDEMVRKLSVAAIYSVGMAHINDFLHEFEKAHPHADIKLDYMHPEHVYQAVEQGEVDLGLVSYAEDSRTLTATPWRNEPLVLVCHPEHILAERESITLADLEGEDFVAFETDLRIRSEIDRELMVNKVAVNIAHEFDNIENIKRDLELGTGISILPKPTIDRELTGGTLKCVPILEPEMFRPLGIIQRSDRQINKIAQKFIELLCQKGQLNGTVTRLATNHVNTLHT